MRPRTWIRLSEFPVRVNIFPADLFSFLLIPKWFEEVGLFTCGEEDLKKKPALTLGFEWEDWDLTFRLEEEGEEKRGYWKKGL